MKRKLLSLVLASAMIVGCLTACGQEAKEEQPASNSSTPKQEASESKKEESSVVEEEEFSYPMDGSMEEDVI